MAKTIFEEFIVTGEDLLKEVKKLIRKGNIRRLMIKNNRGEILVETSLTFGAAGIGGLIVLAPFLSAVAFIALMMTEAKIVVERDPSVDDKEVEPEGIEVMD
ncbi:MAG: DUF4342 domain-containing protein [Bacteroidetes bacterium]|nr:DUF4342 domain-containing protein [Bacteroidota bacterium]MCH8524817.1 DUF4342 domain-containing protein [Balneolales bacterium]